MYERSVSVSELNRDFKKVGWKLKWDNKIFDKRLGKKCQIDASTLERNYDLIDSDGNNLCFFVFRKRHHNKKLAYYLDYVRFIEDRKLNSALRKIPILKLRSLFKALDGNIAPNIDGYEDPERRCELEALQSAVGDRLEDEKRRLEKKRALFDASHRVNDSSLQKKAPAKRSLSDKVAESLKKKRSR